MPRKRLLDNHPTMAKIAELEEKARELGLSFTFHHGQACTVRDRQFPTVEFQLIDAEDSGHESIVPDQFPAPFEYKVVYEY